MNMEKFKNPMIAMLICFIVIILSIYQIINLAQPNANKTAAHLCQNDQIANLKNQKYLSYEDILTFKTSFKDNPLVNKISLNPQWATLQPQEQDLILRNKLNEWQSSCLIDVSTILVGENQSLIFNICFWIWSIFLWAASIFGSRIVNHYAENFVKRYCE